MVQGIAYWSWNANSGDTGGLVDDKWTNIEWTKVNWFIGASGLHPWYLGSSPSTPTVRPQSMHYDSESTFALGLASSCIDSWRSCRTLLPGSSKQMSTSETQSLLCKECCCSETRVPPCRARLLQSCLLSPALPLRHPLRYARCTELCYAKFGPHCHPTY